MQLTKIRKRNGDLVDYDFNKVEDSVKKTFICTYGEIPKYVQFKHLKNSLENYLNDKAEEMKRQLKHLNSRLSFK